MTRLVEKNRIIHALDVENKEKALRIAGDVRDYVDAIKISYPLALKYGARVIHEIKEKAGIPILACFKIADIPQISRRIMQTAVDSGADGITVHGIFGRDTLETCVNLGGKNEVDVYVVTEMSHPGAVEFTQPLGQKIARMAREVGATGIIAPATRPSRITMYRQIVGHNMFIISPGVGPQGGKIGDAILHGANFEIVGRLIYNSSNQGEAARNICSELKKRLEAEAYITI